MSAQREPTPAQQAILVWLASYPGIHITYTPGSRHPARWSHSWASEAARRDMVEMMHVLGSDATKANPGGSCSRLGATPHLTKGTFDALRDRGWIRPITRDTRCSSSWQISAAGLQQIGVLASISAGPSQPVARQAED